MSNKGFLLVFMHPPSAFEEEFNAWYDGEHIPERLAVPGFLTGLRYMNTGGGAPRYLAMYDIENYEVLDSPEYHRVGYEQASPWTKRVTARARVQRFAGDVAGPVGRVTGRAARIGIIRFRALSQVGIAEVTAGMATFCAGLPAVISHRVLLDRANTPSTDVIGFIEACAPLPESFDPALFGSAAPSVDLVAQYTPF